LDNPEGSLLEMTGNGFFAFPFLPIPIPEESFNCCGINNFSLSKTRNVHCLSLSLQVIWAKLTWGAIAAVLLVW